MQINIKFNFIILLMSLNQTVKTVSKTLYQHDKELYNIIRKETVRQQEQLNFIASENYTPTYCSQVLGSCLPNKYSEGSPKIRYYAGTKFIDELESLTINRTLKAFDLDSNEWGANVQTLSGSPANFALYTAILQPNDKILAMNLQDGGHLSHGYKGNTGSATATAKYFDTYFYGLDPKTQRINYENMKKLALEIKPKLIIAGASAYPREIDYKYFREVCDMTGSYLLMDAAHIIGLIMAKELESPFPYIDFLTTTTHKTLRGPRGAFIIFRKKYANQINKAVFPGLQGGPHNHAIGALCAALKAGMEPEFKQYAINIKSNMKIMSDYLIKHGYKILTDGTDNHLLLMDLKNKNITGVLAQEILDHVNIVTNKNSLYNDKKGSLAGGIRLGSAPMTTRGMSAAHFEESAHYIDLVLREAMKNSNIKPNSKDYHDFLKNNSILNDIKQKAERLAKLYSCPSYTI